jgi:hypothetical protein
MKTFRKLDAYAKTIDDFRVRTATGGTGKVQREPTLHLIHSFQ